MIQSGGSKPVRGSLFLSFVYSVAQKTPGPQLQIRAADTGYQYKTDIRDSDCSVYL